MSGNSKPISRSIEQQIYEFQIEEDPTLEDFIIDFIRLNDVLLRVKYARDMQRIDLNDFIGGTWREEYSLNLQSNKNKFDITIHLTAFSATVRFFDGQTIIFDSDQEIGAFDRISTTPNVRFSTLLARHKPKGIFTDEGQGQDITSTKAIIPPEKLKSSSAKLEDGQSLAAAIATSVGFLAQPQAELDDPFAAQHPIAPPPGTDAPGYVQEVYQEYQTVKLQLIKAAVRPTPDRWSPIVVSVVKNEIDRLHDFFRHYRESGIERFCFIDNGSTDGTLEYLSSQNDTDLYKKEGKFDWKLKQGWINRVISNYGLNRWFMYLDADEHIVFDGLGSRTFRDLTIEMENRRILRVRGFLIDMYADCPLLSSNYKSHSRLMDAYPYYDRDSYVEERYKEIVSVKGGPRTRVFGNGKNKFRPELTKYPLFLAQSGEYMVNPHHNWPYVGNFYSPRILGILHYKFLPGVIDRIKAAVAAKNYWDGSFEYQCYLDAVEKDVDLTLMYNTSAMYKCPEDLVRNNLLQAVGWQEELKSGVVEFRSELLKVRAELQGKAGMSRFMLLKYGNDGPDA